MNCFDIDEFNNSSRCVVDSVCGSTDDTVTLNMKLSVRLGESRDSLLTGDSSTSSLSFTHGDNSKNAL